METAFVASYGSGKPIIGFLGEYDCLPELSQEAIPTRKPVKAGGPGHGCGHNLLGTGSVGAAVALKHQLDKQGIEGTVRYYGCPAEETLIGKVFMAKAGVFDDLDIAITWHPMWLNAPWAGSSLAMNSVRFRFHGRTAHAAAAPHLGISALDAVELMNTGVNFLREHVTSEARIHYVITNGGNEPNVVPSLAEVWYYVRAPRRQDVEEIYERMLDIAKGASLMTRAELEVDFQTGVYEFLPNEVVSDALLESLREAGPPQFSDEEKQFATELAKSFSQGEKEAVLRASNVPPRFYDLTLHEEIGEYYDRGKILPGSTDVGDVSWIAPTGQITTATWVMGTASHSWQATAASGMGIGYKGMLLAAKAMALTGHKFLTNPDLVKKARDAFEKDTGGRPYESPLPEGMDTPAKQVH